ncbi:hypothetical protein [Lusitaniella coriacea]|uniref:hypothetical protein n=1 Tax=Lusitaniella coriacea TaxID=1983105 RepID=UPI003CEA6988
MPALLDWLSAISEQVLHSKKEIPMLKQMAWLPTKGSDETKILHLRVSRDRGWKPYTAFPEYAVPDYRIAGGSKGYATFQTLFNQGWKLVSSDRIVDAALQDRADRNRESGWHYPESA